jgi:hypothetical protein
VHIQGDDNMPDEPTSSLAVTKSKESAVKVLSVATWPTDYRLYAICGIVIAAMLLLAGYQTWGKLVFDDKASILSIFSSMLLVALFVERAIEVFVSVWVDRDSAIHEQNLDYWQQRQGQLAKEVQALVTERGGADKPKDDRLIEIDKLLTTKRAAIDEAVTCADNEEKALLPFQARTLKVSTWVGLVIGVITSAVGFRFLAQLVKPDAAFIASPQNQWFVGVDILLTGAVLAGGSKLIHNIFSVYTSFMSTTSKALSDQSKTQ